jgi:hypothetical protein
MTTVLRRHAGGHCRELFYLSGTTPAGKDIQAGRARPFSGLTAIGSTLYFPLTMAWHWTLIAKDFPAPPAAQLQWDWMAPAICYHR